jgi:putative addiction module component (TIGR02574 family)
MTGKARALLEQVLKLPRASRAALAKELIDSLESEPDDEDEQDDIDAAWEAEAARRMREVKEGRAELIPSKVVHDQLRRSLRAKRKK